MDNSGYHSLSGVPYIPRSNSNITNSNGLNLGQTNSQPPLTMAQSNGPIILDMALTNPQNSIAQINEGQALLNVASQSVQNIAQRNMSNILDVGAMSSLSDNQSLHVGQLGQPGVTMALHSSSTPIVTMATALNSSANQQPGSVSYVSFDSISHQQTGNQPTQVASSMSNSMTNIGPMIVGMHTTDFAISNDHSPLVYGILKDPDNIVSVPGSVISPVSQAKNEQPELKPGLLFSNLMPNLKLGISDSNLRCDDVKSGLLDSNSKDSSSIWINDTTTVSSTTNQQQMSAIVVPSNLTANSHHTNTTKIAGNSHHTNTIGINSSNQQLSTNLSPHSVVNLNNLSNTGVLNYIPEVISGKSSDNAPIIVPTSNIYPNNTMSKFNNANIDISSDRNVQSSASHTITKDIVGVETSDSNLNTQTYLLNSNVPKYLVLECSNFQGDSFFERNEQKSAIVENNVSKSDLLDNKNVNKHHVLDRNVEKQHHLLHRNVKKHHKVQSSVEKLLVLGSNAQKLPADDHESCVENDIEHNSNSNNIMLLDEESGMILFKEQEEIKEDVFINKEKVPDYGINGKDGSNNHEKVPAFEKDGLNNVEKMPDFQKDVLNDIEKVPDFEKDVLNTVEKVSEVPYNVLSNSENTTCSGSDTISNSDTDIDKTLSDGENNNVVPSEDSDTILLHKNGETLLPANLDQSDINNGLHLNISTETRSSKKNSKPNTHSKTNSVLKNKIRSKRSNIQQQKDSKLNSVSKKGANVNVKKKRRKKKGSKSSRIVPTCHVCSKTYSNNDILKRHISSVHKKSFDKFCSVCKKGFVNMYALKVHSLSHSGLKPFQCEEPDCNNMYSTKQLLQFHYRFCHGYSDSNMPDIKKKKDLFPENSFITCKSMKNCREYFNEFGVKVREESMDIDPPVVEMEGSNHSDDNEEEVNNDDVIGENNTDTPDKNSSPNKKNFTKTKNRKKIGSALTSLKVAEQEELFSDSETKRGDKTVKRRTKVLAQEVVSLCPKKRKASEINVEYSWKNSQCLGKTKFPTIIPASAREINNARLSNCQTCYTCHVEDRCPLRYPEHIVPNDLDYPMGFFMPDPILFGKSKVYSGKSSLYARDDIKPFTRFGPLLGRPLNIDDLRTLHVADIELEHFWPVITDEDSAVNVSMYIDTKDVTQSNWLRFLLPAPYKENDRSNFNLQRVMLNNEVYFVTTRKVSAGEELLMRPLEPPERLFYNLAAQRKENNGSSCFLCKKWDNNNKDNQNGRQEEEHLGKDTHLPVFENTLWFVRHFRLEHNIGHGGLHFATMYMCYVCNEEFNSKSECNKHKTEVHPEVVGKRPPLYQCPICYEKVTCKPSVRYHRAKFHPRLTELGPQKCPKCERVLDSQAQLLSHLNKSHNPEDHQPVTCNVCQKRYKNAAVLKRHMDKTHERKFYKFCDLCGKSFRDMYQLRVHSLTHSGLKPFVCEVQQCTHAFTTKQWLQKHYRTTHGFTDETMPLIHRKMDQTS